MEDILQKLTECIVSGKINRASPYPPDMAGRDGADELAGRALEEGIGAEQILDALIAGMTEVGNRFSRNLIFVPQMLTSAKAMNVAMKHLEPAFDSGAARRKGTFVLGTVQGDVHDIGKNIVAMCVEGNGYKVINLGVDVPPERFMEEIEKHPNCVVGLSALLTTTMINMKKTVGQIREQYPEQIICIGGAPVTERFRKETGADLYSPDPQGAVAFLDRMAS